MVVLVELGSTHNFLAPFTDKGAWLGVEEFARLHVHVANGESI